MSYSSDEKTAAVESLVQGTLTYPTDRLGPRDQATEFAEVMETVYSVLLYDPDAIYYLVYLARNSLKRIIKDEVVLCDSLLDAIDDLSMPNKPVDSISSLSSTRNSLQAMDSALARSGSVAGSEYHRYQQAITKFKQQLGKTVKMTYLPRGETTPVKDIVRPSARAKVDVLSDFASLKTQHAKLLEQLGYLQESLSGFAGGKVSSKVGFRQIARARSQLDDLYEKLEGLTAEERILEAREALLTVLSNESVVKGIAEPVSGQSKFYQKPSSSPTYMAGAHGEGTAPSVTGTTSAPFPLFDSAAAAPTNKLSFASLNNFPEEVDLFPTSSPSYAQGIQQASVVGSKDGPFEIGADLSTPADLVSASETFNITSTSNTLYLVVDGTTYECTLSTGGSQTATNVKADLDTPGNWTPSIPEITVSDAGGEVSITYNVTTPPVRYSQRYMRILQGFNNASALGPWSDTITRGWDGNNKLWIKANDDPSYVEVTLPSGSAVAASAVRSAINTAGGSAFTAQLSGGKVQILSELSGEGSIITILSAGVRESPDTREGFSTESQAGMSTLGFSEGQESREADIDGRVVVNVLNGHGDFAEEATAQLVRTDVFDTGRAVQTAADSLSLPSTTDVTSSWPSTELKLSISSGPNRGIYKIDSHSWSSGSITVTLDRRLRDNTSDVFYSVSIFSEVLKISSTDAGLTGEIDLDDPSGSARAALGLSSDVVQATVNEILVEKNSPIYGWLPEDLSRLRIRTGDLLFDGGGSQVATILSLSQLSDGILIVDTGVAPSLQLSTGGFSIQSGYYYKCVSFIADMSTWITEELSPFEENLDWIDRSLGKILLSTPSRTGVDIPYTRVSQLKSKLEALDVLCDTFSVSAIFAVDSALQTLLEHGYDRARNLLITGQTESFFSVTAADASYSKAFQKAANEVIVQDINRASQAKSRFDSEFVRLRENWEEDQHPDHDFSDLEEELPEDSVIDYYLGVNEFEEI